MGKTMRTISGWRWVWTGAGYVAEPWSKTFEVEDADPIRAEMGRIKKQFEGLYKRQEEAKLHYYTILGAKAIDPIVRGGAEAALKICVSQLKIGWPLSIIWIDEESSSERAYFLKYGNRDWDFINMDSPILGKTKNYSDKIWILNGLSFWDTIKVVAHEAIHVIQSVTQPIAEREREAEVFAYQIVNELSRVAAI